MSFNIGKVVGSIYAKVHNTVNGQKAQHLLVQYPGGGKDVRTIQLVNLAGFQTNPVDGSVAITIDSGSVGSIRFVIGHDDLIKMTAERGEAEMYSSDGSGAKLMRIQARRNGLLTIQNVGTGYTLRGALDNLILGIQGATCPSGGGPLADTTGKIATAMAQLHDLLDSGIS